MDCIEFESIKIGLASPDQIREWAHGEVKGLVVRTGEKIDFKW